MAKYAISLYEDLAKKPQLFQTIVDRAFNERYNAVLWKQYFQWDTTPSPDDMFKTIEVVDKGVIMADIAARFADVSQRDTDGYAYYAGTVPDLSHGYKENVADLIKIERLQSGLDGNAAVIRNLVSQIDKFVNGIHSRITNMAMQLMSSGKIEGNAGTGLSYKAKAPIPTTNFKKALTAVWTDTENATPISDMVAHEKYMRNTLGYTGALEWNINRTTLNLLLKNKEVKSYVLPVLLSANLSVLPNGMVTEASFQEFVKTGGIISNVRVVDEAQREASMTGVTTVNGWKAGSAVLRPAGFAGVVKYSSLDELRMVQGEQGVAIAYLEGGKVGIKRKFSVDNERWDTSVKSAAVPTLTQWNYHMIVDTLSV